MRVAFATTFSTSFALLGIAFRPHSRPRIAEGLTDSLGSDTARGRGISIRAGEHRVFRDERLQLKPLGEFNGFAEGFDL